MPAPWRVIALRIVLADVEVERIAELVRLVLVGAFVARARALDLVAAGAILQQPLEQVAERALTDAADALAASAPSGLRAAR